MGLSSRMLGPSVRARSWAGMGRTCDAGGRGNLGSIAGGPANGKPLPTLHPLKVTDLTAYSVRIPLKKRIKHASHARTETDNVLVRAVLNDKSVGWGEGVPREYV